MPDFWRFKYQRDDWVCSSYALGSRRKFLELQNDLEKAYASRSRQLIHPLCKPQFLLSTVR